MNITIKLDTVTLDVDEEGEVLRILRDLTDTLESEGFAERVSLRDLYGNAVGSFRCEG